MQKMVYLFTTMLLLTAFSVLNGCGSADLAGPSGAAGNVAYLTGLASSGAPLGGAVTLKDYNGVTRTAQIDDQGGYLLDVTELTAPFILRAGGYYSFAAAGGRVNINPLSNAATYLASDYAGGLDALYADDQHLRSNLAIIAVRLSTVVFVMEESLSLANLYASTVTGAERDFLNGIYRLDQGVDRLFSTMSPLIHDDGSIALTQSGQSIPFMTLSWAQGTAQPAISVNPIMAVLLAATLSAAHAAK